MAPEGAKPLHMGMKTRVAGEGFKSSKDIPPAHLLKAPEQGARIIKHDPGIAALTYQLGNDLSKPLVTVGKGFGVVVITLARVFIHVLQVRDQLAAGPRRNRGLMHVKRAGKSGADLLQLKIGMGGEKRSFPLHQGKKLPFLTRDRRKAGAREHGKLGRKAGWKDEPPVSLL